MCCLGNPYYDSVGSLGVGTLLGTVSAFLIYTNTEALLGRSIQPEQLQRLTELLESDPVVRWESLQLKNSTEQQKQENNVMGKIIRALKKSLLVLRCNLLYWDFRMLVVTDFCAKNLVSECFYLPDVPQLKRNCMCVTTATLIPRISTWLNWEGCDKFRSSFKYMKY